MKNALGTSIHVSFQKIYICWLKFNGNIKAQLQSWSFDNSNFYHSNRREAVSGFVWPAACIIWWWCWGVVFL